MLSRRSLLFGSAASLLQGAPRAELQPYFPSPAHQFVWRNWDLVPADRIAAALGCSTSAVQELGREMYLGDGDAAREYDERLRFSVLRRNWFFVPKEQILPMIGMTGAELETLLDHDAFYRAHLSKQPDVQTIRLGSRARAGKPLRWFEPPPQTGTPEPRFAFERALAEPMAAPPRQRTRKRPATIAYPYFCPYGDILALDDYQRYYPQGLLQRMAAHGVSAIWLHALLRDLVPTKLFKPKPHRLERLQWIVDQCASAGLGVYVYLNEPRAVREEFYERHPELRGAPGRPGDGLRCMCTSAPATREFLFTGTRDLFRSVPGLEGVILITASENPTNCYSLTRTPDCPRCSKRSAAEVIGEVVASVERGVHEAKPSAEVIAWDWSWGLIEDDPQASIIAALPKGVTLQVDFERGTPIVRLGAKAQVDEYSISVPGPSPRASAHLALAQKRGLPVMAKTQIGTTWELATVPFLPVLDLIAEKMRAFHRNGLSGGMLSWTLGSCPSMNWELVHLLSSQKGDSSDPVLEIARRRYGRKAAPKVRAAWKIFSDAFRTYPFSNALVYSSFVLEGPAHRLYPKPSGLSARILNSFDTLGWTEPFGPERVAALFRKMGDEWRRGVELFRAAISEMNDSQRELAEQDAVVTEAAGLYFDSIAAEVTFYLERNRSNIASAEARRSLQEQLRAAERLLALCARDSRIGFEASIGYVFLPLDIREKLAACRYLLEEVGGVRA
jgi:hypothetical protein